MKKMLSLLSVLSIFSMQASSLISCSPKGEAIISKNFGDIISSLDAIDTNQLLQYRVKLEDFFNNAEYAKLLAFLGIKNIVANEKDQQELRVIEDNMRVVQMANQFLFNIARNIPGYDWIYRKLRWQAGEFGIVDLSKTSKALEWFYNITSGWLKSNDQWSLSVTFLDDNLSGWKYGVGTPEFARININKRVKANSAGNIIKEESDPQAIWKSKNDSENIFAPVVGKDGSAIYQGFYYSSRLLNVGGIYRKNSTEILPTNVVDYSLTAMDWVNNKINSGTNEILASQQDNISKWLINHFEKNPMYVTDDDLRSHTKLKVGRDGFINKELKQQVGNQIYLVLLRTCLNRMFVYSDKDKDKDMLSYADADSQILLSNLYNVLFNFKKHNQNKTEILNKVYNVDYSLDDIYELKKNTPANNIKRSKKSSPVFINIEGKDVNLTIESFLSNYDKIEELSNTHLMNKQQADAIVTFINEIISDPKFRELTEDHTALNFNDSYDLSINTNLYIFDSDFKPKDIKSDSQEIFPFKTDTLTGNVASDDKTETISSQRARLENLGITTKERIFITYLANNEKPEENLLEKLTFDPDLERQKNDPDIWETNKIFANAYMFDRIHHLMLANNINTKEVYNDKNNSQKYAKFVLNNDDSFNKAMDSNGNTNNWSYAKLVSYLGSVLGEKIKNIMISDTGLGSGIPVEYWDKPSSYSDKVYKKADLIVANIIKKYSNFIYSFNLDSTQYITNIMNQSIEKDGFSKYMTPSQNAIMFGQINSYGDLISSNKLSDIATWQKFKLNDIEKMLIAYDLSSIENVWDENVVNNNKNPDHN